MAFRAKRAVSVRILLLCDRFPWPLTNGQNLRIYHYVQQLHGQHSFDLGCYGQGAAPTEIRGLFRLIFTWSRPTATRAGGLKRVVEACDVRKFVPSSKEAQRMLADPTFLQGYDLIWVSGWDMIVNLPRPCSKPILADAVDDGVLEYWREFKITSGFGARIRMLKWVLMNIAFERRYFGAADHVMFVSTVDAATFAKVAPGIPVSVVVNGVDEEFYKPSGVSEDPGHIVFEGNIGFAPNVDGLLYFVEEIFPLIVAAEPTARFTIVGRDPPEQIRALVSDRIAVTGYVDDVRPFVDRASLVVSPLRKGAGIKNKILQAWAMGKSVVATSLSLGGLALEPGVHALVADSAAAFAQGTVALLRDREARQRMGWAARSRVVEQYTWCLKARQLDALFTRVASRATC